MGSLFICFFQTYVQTMINAMGLMSILQMFVFVKTRKIKVTFRITTCIVSVSVTDQFPTFNISMKRGSGVGHVHVHIKKT